MKTVQSYPSLCLCLPNFVCLVFVFQKAMQSKLSLYVFFCIFNSVLVDINATQSCLSCGMVVNRGTWPIIILPVVLLTQCIDSIYHMGSLYTTGPPSVIQFGLRQWKSGEGQKPHSESSCHMRLYKEYKRQAFPIGSPWFLSDPGPIIVVCPCQ